MVQITEGATPVVKTWAAPGDRAALAPPRDSIPGVHAAPRADVAATPATRCLFCRYRGPQADTRFPQEASDAS